MKSKFIIALTLLLTQVSLWAQQYSQDYYIYPLEGVERLYSANFGELRSDHFHSGVDIKTDGVEGKKVVAVADGYISRISLSPYGYGLALYVTHPNGTTSVYGHLSRFMAPVAAYVEAERYRTKQNSVNLFCTSKQFAVKQGDVIAYSGNTGSSAGPHLHFEIRDGVNQEPINVVAQKIIEPRDTISPLIMKLHYIEIDSLQGVAREAYRRSYDVEKGDSGYALTSGEEIPVGRKGYFVLEASDRRNGVTNTFGIYQLRASIDGKRLFEYSMDRFSYSTTRYCNAIGYYPIMIESRNEALRLAASENSDMSHYRYLANRGLVTTSADQRRSVKIEVMDDCGNSSQLNFGVVGKADDKRFLTVEVDPKMVVLAKKPFSYRGEGVAVSIEANTLYNSAVFSCKDYESTDSAALSKTFEIFSYATPLHKAMALSIAADIPAAMQSKVGLVYISRTGAKSFLKGSYSGGVVTSSSRNAGKFYVAVDNTPPTLKPGIEEGSNQSRSNYFTCAIADDLSGVSSYSATLDGKWIALDLAKGRVRYNFRDKPNGARHTLVIEAVDGVGNKTTITRNFIR